VEPLRTYAEKETAGCIQRSNPLLEERPEFAGDSQKPPNEVKGQNTVRVSQLLPALGDGGTRGGEGNMRMGCRASKGRMEGARGANGGKAARGEGQGERRVAAAYRTHQSESMGNEWKDAARAGKAFRGIALQPISNNLTMFHSTCILRPNAR
jgi:hypothetical protein